MPQSLADQLPHVTVQIECEQSSGSISYGTGFIINLEFPDYGYRAPIVITNKHVIRGAQRGNIRFTEKDENGNPSFGNLIHVPIENFQSMWFNHPNENIDLAAAPIASILTSINDGLGKQAYYRALSENDIADEVYLNQLNAIEDIIMIGYPNGLWDAKNNMPVVRRGITATPPFLEFEGRPEFLIDCACFRGSSGSPILLFNWGSYAGKEGGITIGSRLQLLGVLYAGPQFTAEGDIQIAQAPTAERFVSRSHIPMNIGNCIKASQLKFFHEYFTQRISDSHEQR